MFTHKKIMTAVSAILLAAVMIIIFLLSAQPASESQKLSDDVTAGGFISAILGFLGIDASAAGTFAHIVRIVRKLAHFCEFAALGFTAFWHISCFEKSFKKPALLSAAIGILYAVSDEIHQIFVEGRACRIFDVFIDSCGVICGMFACLLLVLIIVKIRQKADTKKSKA